jgi:hypothetical protein
MSFNIPETPSQVFAGKVGLVAGVANDQSIAYGCARAFRDMGASLAITYADDKARPFVERLAQGLSAQLFLPLDVRNPAQMAAVFTAIRDKWGRLDFPRAFDRVRPESRPAWPARRQFCGGLSYGDGHLLPLLHTDGKACRAANDRGRRNRHDDLLRRR